MHDISLKLQKRDVTGKRVAKLRQDGFVPSVVYGGNDEPISTQSAVVETTKVVHEAGRHTPVKLTIDGSKQLAIIKDVDFDPVKHQVRHIAFHAIRQDDVITTEVSLVFTGKGESPAERAGLIILQALDTVEVKAKPADLPESLEISTINLESTHDKITLADVTLPEGVEYADAEQDLHLVIANVYEPAALEAANEAAAGDAEDESEVEVEGDDEATAEGDESKESSDESSDKSS
ncbi:50S ribosomal protein L25 [Candidatus Saccharibacteria bacterium]|nr:50S ribosomal protein L25 [Candidatus Saccharibacteria bacterium]NCS82921.1 50S ribosomal protein L25 [Candidatus Saccharibacteria bacterium]